MINKSWGCHVQAGSRNQQSSSLYLQVAKRVDLEGSH